MANTDISVWDRLRERLAALAATQNQFLDPAVLAAKLSNRARVLRNQAKPATSSGIPLHFLAFHKADERYGIPIDDVLELQILDQFTPIPHAPSFMPGVVHWRGAILTLIDPGKLFGIPETGIADTHTCVIVEAAYQRVALLTGEVDDIYCVSRDEIKPVPALPENIPAEWFIGVHDESRLIFRMDQILQDPRLLNWQT